MPVEDFDEAGVPALPEASRVESRARELLTSGRTPLRAFRVLKREFPNAEWHVLWIAVGEGPTGITPTWAQNGSSPAEARYRLDPRKDEPPTRDVRSDNTGDSG